MTPATNADTLFLASGRTLKINELRCDRTTCIAALAEGTIEVRPTDILRVEPDEEVDPAPAAKDPGLPRGIRPDRTLEQIIADAASKYALPRSLVRAVARAESALSPAAVSPKGAQGVMQLMPDTAKKLGVRRIFDPVENIDAGTRLLRQLLEKYKGRVAEALAAYNAGEGAVAKHNGVPPYLETRSYIRQVVKDFEKDQTPSPSPSPSPEKKQ